MIIQMILTSIKIKRKLKSNGKKKFKLTNPKIIL